jgi:Up-Regulated in long-lived daf-2
MKKISSVLLGLFLSSMTIAIAANSASASTERQAKASINNQTGKTIVHVTLLHKYSNDYKNNRTWVNLPSGHNTSASPLNVQYRTGVFTTGKDWWRVQWKVADGRTCYTDPNNFRVVFDALDQAAMSVANLFADQLGKEVAGQVGGIGGEVTGKVAKDAANGIANSLFNGEATVGFKQNILRAEDDNKMVTISLFGNNTARISSPSGISNTVYTCK